MPEQTLQRATPNKSATAVSLSDSPLFITPRDAIELGLVRLKTKQADTAPTKGNLAELGQAVKQLSPLGKLALARAAFVPVGTIRKNTKP